MALRFLVYLMIQFKDIAKNTSVEACYERFSQEDENVPTAHELIPLLDVKGMVRLVKVTFGCV